MDRTKLLVNKINQKRWIFMWVLVFLGYVLFLVNWMLFSGLAGNVASTDANGNVVQGTGWLDTFFTQNNQPNALIIQAINYSSTFIRGIGALVVGMLMMKMTHKWATVFSIALMLAGIPAIWMNNYWVFIILRMFLAFGGTMLVILLQPIKSVLEIKIKKKLTTLATFGFSIGAIISLAPFIWSVEVNKIITDNWQLIGTVVASLTLIILILYLIIGENFLPKEKQQKFTLIDLNTGKAQKPRWRIRALLKEWRTYIWIILFGTYLVILVMPIILGTDLFTKSTNSFAVVRDVKIWVIVSLIGVLIGPWTIGLWLKTNFQRKPFIIFIIFVTCLTLVLSFVFWKLNIMPLFFILGFIFGWLVQSIQGVILYLAHEDEVDKAEPKRLASFYGIIWGCGYWVFTIFNIIMSVIKDYGGTYFDYWILLTYMISGIICIITTLFIRETKPEGKIFSFKRAPKGNKNFLSTSNF